MNIGVVLLARMGSSRLPGKVLLDLCGEPVLGRIVERLRRVEGARGGLIVATTMREKDEQIAAYCHRVPDVNVYRGEEENVLRRCLQVCREFHLDAMVRLGADNPLVDWRLINEMLDIFTREREHGNPLDYVSNSLDRSYPLGLDAEIITRDALKKVEYYCNTLPQEERATHEANVIPHIHQHPELFHVYSHKAGFDYSFHRWTMDTPEDYELIRRIYEALYPIKPDFVMEDVLALLGKHPDWVGLNGGVMPRTGFWTVKEKERLQRLLSTKGVSRDAGIPAM